MYRLMQQQQQQQQQPRKKQQVVTQELQEAFSSGPPSTRDEDDPPVLTRHASAPNLSATTSRNNKPLTAASQDNFDDDDDVDVARSASTPCKRFGLRQKKPEQSKQQQQQQRESAPQRRPARTVWKRSRSITASDDDDGEDDDEDDQASVSSFRSWLTAPSSSRRSKIAIPRRESSGNTAGTKRAAMKRNTIMKHYPDPAEDKPTQPSRLDRFRTFHSSSWRKKTTTQPSHDQVVADFFDVQSLPSEHDYAATRRRRRLFGGIKASTSNGDVCSVTSLKSRKSLSFRRSNNSRRPQRVVSTIVSDGDDDIDEITIGSDFSPPSSALASRSSDLDAVVCMSTSFLPAKEKDHSSKKKCQQNRSILAHLFPNRRRHRCRKKQADDNKHDLPDTLNDFPTTRHYENDEDGNDDDDLDAELAEINNVATWSPRSTAATFNRWSPIPVDPSHMMMLPGTPPPAPPRRVRSLDDAYNSNNGDCNGYKEMDELSSESSDEGKMQVVSLGLVGRVGSPCHHDQEDDDGFRSLASEESKHDDYGKKETRRLAKQQADNHSDGDDSSILSLLSNLLITWATESSDKHGLDDLDELQDRPCHSPIQLSGGRILRSCLKKPALEQSSSSPSKLRNNSVTFSVVQVREFERTVGDNPSCSTGPPVGLGWAYHDATPDIAVDDHAQLPKRTKRQFHLPPATRTTLLTEEWSVPEQDIRQARREATYIQYCREKTAFTGGRRDSSGKALRRQGQAATPEQQQRAVVSGSQQATTTTTRRPGPDQTATVQPSRFRRCNSLEDYGPSTAVVSIRRSISLGRSSMDGDENDGCLPNNSSRFDIGEAGTSTIPAPPRRRPSGQLLEV